jgi:hypothetical protein
VSHIPADLRRLVVTRAGDRCEYCGLAQQGQEATFHIDHVVPASSGGQTAEENLALACVSCSLHKAARQEVPDPQTGKPVFLFNPRHDRWREHFRWEEVYIIGLTPTGRATVAALQMNREMILSIRQLEIVVGRHPPPGD